MMLSIVIPVLDEAERIAACLTPLQTWRGAGCELVVVDGGSGDSAAERATPLADRVLVAPRGRAQQMNAGAAVARGDALWFVHADTAVPADAPALIGAALAAGKDWGRFDVRLSGAQPLLRVIERAMNARSRLSGIATGDQGIFVRRERFEAVGGYPAIALMEDIALSKALKRAAGWPACLRAQLLSSSRRWEHDGIVRTVVLMWRLRLAYFCGADPEALRRRYYGG